MIYHSKTFLQIIDYGRVFFNKSKLMLHNNITRNFCQILFKFKRRRKCLSSLHCLSFHRFSRHRYSHTILNQISIVLITSQNLKHNQYVIIVTDLNHLAEFLILGQLSQFFIWNVETKAITEILWYYIAEVEAVLKFHWSDIKVIRVMLVRYVIAYKLYILDI